MKLQRHSIHVTLFGIFVVGVSAATLIAAPLQVDAKPAKAKQNAPQEAQPASPDAEHMPEADAIIDRHIEALGGEKAIKEKKYRKFVGEMTISGQGIKGDMTIYQAEPHFFLLDMQSDALGNIKQGSNGELAWSMDMLTGARILDGSEKETALKDADFHGELNYKKHYPERKTLGKEEFDNTACWKVQLKSPTGREVTNYYSLDTGLLVGMKGELDSPNGKLSTLAHVKEYKEIDGIKFPMVTVLDFTDFGVSQTITFKSVSHDEFSRDVFELPKEIKTLAEHKPADKGDDDDKKDEPSEPAHEE